MASNRTSTEKSQDFANQVKEEITQAMPQEQQLNVWIPKDLMKRLKVKGAEIDKSLKEMVTEALNQFL